MLSATSQQSSRSSLSSSPSGLSSVEKAEFGKVSKRDFKNLIAKVKADALVYGEFNKLVYGKLKRNDEVRVRPTENIGYKTNYEKNVKKFAARSNTIKLNPGDKTFKLERELVLDSATLKLYKNFVEEGFSHIELASRLGRGRATFNAGSILNQEGVDFIRNAFFTDNVDVITVDDVAKFARSNGVAEEAVPDFVDLYSKFLGALQLSFDPKYGDEETNRFMRYIIDTHIANKLVNFYRKIKFGKSENGRYRTTAIIRNMRNAYQKALDHTAKFEEEWSRKIGVNWQAVKDLLRKYARPALTEAEIADIESTRVKTKKEEKRKMYKNKHRAAILSQLKGLYPAFDDKLAKKLVRNVEGETTDNEFSSLSLMIMHHAIIDSANTNKAFKSSDNAAEEKRRKELLKQEIRALDVHFTDRTQTDASVVFGRANSLVTAGNFAVAAKLINAYISSVYTMLKAFIADHKPKTKRRTRKVDVNSLASVLSR